MANVNLDVAALIATGRAAGSLPFEAMSPDEARRAYADRLERDGVNVTLLQFADQPHGVITMTKVVRASIGIQDFVAATLRVAVRSTTHEAAASPANQPWAVHVSAV